MVKVKDSTNTAGIHIKLDETGAISIVAIYPYTGINRSPILVQPTEMFTIGYWQQVTGNLNSYVVDLENDSLSFFIKVGAFYGAVGLHNNTEEFTYSPHFSIIRDFSIFSASDNQGGIVDIRIDITVN